MPDQEKNTQVPSQKMYIDISGRGGLAPRWFGDEGDTFSQHPEYRYIGTEDQKTATDGETTASDFAAGVWNPSRRYGYMAPANNSFTAVANSTGTSYAREIRATCYDPLSKKAFYAENQNTTAATGCSIWINVTNTATTWSLLNTPTWSWPNTTIYGFTDCVIYQLNGVPYMLASYMTSSSSGDILAFGTNGDTTNNSINWLTAVASGGSALGIWDHFFVPSTYYLYIVEQNFVHRIDGTSQTGGAGGTFVAKVLVASANAVFTAGISWNGNLFLAAVDAPPTFQTVSSIFPGDNSTYSSNQARVYVWDESVTTIENVQYITITGVKTISKMYVNRAGNLRMLCVSSKRTLQVRQYNGVTFDVIEEGGIQTMPRYRACIQQAGDCIVWQGADGYIYQHGPVTTGETDQLNIIGDTASFVSERASSFFGAMLFLDNNNLANKSRTSISVSVYDSNTSAIYNKLFYPNITGVTSHTGNVYTMVKYFPQLVKVNYARVYHHVGTASVPATIQGTLSIYLNQASSNPLQYSITQQDIAKGFKYCKISQGAAAAVFGIQAEIQWASVTTSDDTDWLPRMLEIDYTPIDKLL
jgi:hypothetical protein